MAVQTMNSLHKRLTAKKPPKKTVQSRRLVLRFVLGCTLAWLGAASTLLLVSVVLLGRTYVFARFLESLVVLGFIGVLYVLARKGHDRSVSYILVGFYELLVVGMYMSWGLYNMQALLLAAFTVIIGGILLGARFALYLALIHTGLLFYLHGHTSQSPTVENDINNINIIFLSVVMGLIALVSWLYNDQMERSLRRAERSEAALKRERDSLEVKVEKRTQKLQEAQMEQLQQVYRFAELGQLSTALLHDLANHLTTISVDIEGLENENNTRILTRLRRTMQYIDNSVHQTRQQLEGQERTQTFSAMRALQEVAGLLTHQASRARVRVELAGPADGQPKPKITGDATRFKQVVTNVISNAIDAYPASADELQRVVTVTLKTNAKNIIITITDFGSGLNEDQLDSLFKPFYTTKKGGMGLGLFISKEITEKSFHGTIRATSSTTNGTTFTISLPRELS